MDNEDGNTGVIESDYVVNTCWIQREILSQELGIKPSVNLQLRFFSDVKMEDKQRGISKCCVLFQGVQERRHALCSTSS